MSPFIGDDYTYEWRFPSAAEPLADTHDVQMRLYDAAGAGYFSTRLRGERRPLSDAQLLLSFARFPMLPAQIITLIHLHAFACAPGFRVSSAPACWNCNWLEPLSGFPTSARDALSRGLARLVEQRFAGFRHGRLDIALPDGD